ncbi:hypothetical protein O9A_01324 [Bartonella koehlerae C-29]|uniref:Uncharacterized protein n=1 Tax=Bartonella koehlerae C-29 TaxID=1134510 RepID=A0A067W476_9HYPH|nr:hypothetical protein O9A_01324 [Bartonella koehlerae C-29]
MKQHEDDILKIFIGCGTGIKLSIIGLFLRIFPNGS